MTGRILLLITFLLLCFNFSFCLEEIEVYRIFGYEDKGNVVGSKIGSLNLVAAHHAGNILRKIALISLSELNDEVFLTILNNKPAGLLIIMPYNRQVQGESTIWKNFYKILNAKSIAIPVYFCFENERILEIYESLLDKSSGNKDKSQDLQFIIRTTEPKLSQQLILEDFYGFLAEASPFKTNLPTIMLISNLDAFLPSPEMKIGLDSYNSGALALLNIMRELYKLEKIYKKINYNILFYLTSSKSFNLETVKSWVNKPENEKYTQQIEYAIFLDSFANSNNLYLQIFNSVVENDARDEPLENLLKAINQTSTLYEKPFKVSTTSEQSLGKKIRFFALSDETYHFSEKSDRPLMNDWSSSKEVLQKNVMFLTELFLKLIMGISKDYKLLDPVRNYDPVFMESVTALLRENYRFPIYLNRDSKINQEAFKLFSTYLKNAGRYTYSLSNPKFYSSKSATMQIMKNVSPFLDLYLFFGIIAWLFVLYYIFGKSKKY